MGFFNDLWTGVKDFLTLGGSSANAQNELVQKQMEREDSTYQRTMTDMAKAGLSPMGMSGADTSTSGTAGIPNTTNNVMQTISTITGLAKGIAEVKNLNVQTVGSGIQNEIAKGNADYLKRLGESEIANTHRHELEKISKQKGFWDKIGDDTYDKLGESINNVLQTGADKLEEITDSIGKLSSGQGLSELKDKAVETGADLMAENTTAGKVVKKVKEKKKDIDVTSTIQLCKYWQSEVDRYAKGGTDPSNLKKLNEARAEFEKAKEKYKEATGKHWTKF